MLFEDYNYNQYNKFVLIDPNKGDSCSEGAPDLDGAALAGGPHHGDGRCADDKQQAPKLTGTALESAVSDQYQHGQLNVATAAERAAAQERAVASRFRRRMERLEA